MRTYIVVVAATCYKQLVTEPLSYSSYDVDTYLFDSLVDVRGYTNLNYRAEKCIKIS